MIVLLLAAWVCALVLLGLNVALALALNDEKRARVKDARVAYQIGHYDGARTEAAIPPGGPQHYEGVLEVPVQVWPVGLDEKWSRQWRITPERLAAEGYAVNVDPQWYGRPGGDA